MSIEEIAYREALRSVEDQQKALDGVRASAGVLLAAASVATSFFKESVVGSEGKVIWIAGLAVFFYVVVIVWAFASVEV